MPEGQRARRMESYQGQTPVQARPPAHRIADPTRMPLYAQAWNNQPSPWLRLPIQEKTAREEGTMPARDGSPQHDKTNATGMPDSLKAGIESLSDLSLDDVHVHYHSPKPAQIEALAYTQGTDIHVGPGQEKHLAHEAWHVVQQKQGRVQPTLQAKGIAINDDQGLEGEADRMGAHALQMASTGQGNCAPETPVRGGAGLQPLTIQRTKGTLKAEKGAKGLLVGAGIGGAIGSVVPGIGTMLGAAIGAGVMALVGAYNADYPIFRNSQANEYEKEMSIYRQWKQDVQKRQNVQETKNIYQSGEFVRYTPATEQIFHRLLCLGQVMYTYEVNKVLTISGKHGTIKHALLAGGGNVYAAGTAELASERTDKALEIKVALEIYQNRSHDALAVLEKAKKMEVEMMQLEEQIKQNEPVKEAHKEEALVKYKEAHKEALVNYKEYMEVAKHYHDFLAQEGVDPNQKSEDIIIPKDEAQVILTEDSGHYHPGYEAGHAAFEGWRNAGYNRLVWNPRWNPGARHQVSVS